MSPAFDRLHNARVDLSPDARTTVEFTADQTGLGPPYEILCHELPDLIVESVFIETAVGAVVPLVKQPGCPVSHLRGRLLGGPAWKPGMKVTLALHNPSCASVAWTLTFCSKNVPNRCPHGIPSKYISECPECAP
ncbi:MAG TPA: hypothetical protein VGK73_03980 [Polyangiaceae bacterium]